MDTIEVPGAPGDVDFLALMAAEHGPTGLFLALVVFVVWKGVWPVLRQVGANAQELFNQHLAQSKESNERLARLEIAVTKSDETNQSAIAGLRQSVESALASATNRLEKHDREIESLRSGHHEHEHRIRGLEHQTGLSGAWRRPPP